MRCEEKTADLSLLLLLLSLHFHLPWVWPPESDRDRQTERQKHTVSNRQIWVGRERAKAVELIGEKGVLFSPSIIVWSQLEQNSQTVRDTKDFLLSWYTSIKHFNVCVFRNLWAYVQCVFEWMEAGQTGCVSSPRAKNACPRPLIISHHRMIILLLNTCQFH